jgi:hypothetical protein
MQKEREKAKIIKEEDVNISIIFFLCEERNELTRPTAVPEID